MAACPARLSSPRRRRYVLTPGRIEANRRNAARSTGPRTSAGKARVARNAIKHGFFVASHRWSPEQQRDFQSTYAGLRDDFRPNSIGEESCVWTIAHSYVRMAAVLRYENIAALEYHQRLEGEMEAKIAAAAPDEAALLRAHREKLRRGGLWRPTLPGPREANAISRYMGKLDRTIRGASLELERLRAFRSGGRLDPLKSLKQSHYPATRTAAADRLESEKTKPLRAAASDAPEALRRTSVAADGEIKTEKTNPSTPMSIGNRHARRRAAALARRRN